ncbi:dipeptide epimerase [Lacticaseibacillus jixiensis]|uniref:dipeptide epimerase n=1 Tax=Lacticaseibacillus jixiensis TaxID=3231926 RepID=UPI0036F1A17E
MTVITSITTSTVALPLRVPFTTARHTVTAARSVQVQIHTQNGHVGIGAGTPNEVVTGDTIASMQAVLQDVLIPALIGCDLRDWQATLTRLHNAVHGNQTAKAALEFALYELRAQQFGVSLPTLLGTSAPTVTTDLTISIKPPAQMLQEARAYVAQGFTALKIKVGGNKLADDLALVKQIAAVLPANGSLRLDANQGWTVAEAASALRELAALHLPIEFVEQPVAAANVAGLQELTALHLLPIMADESVYSDQDALRILALHAADYVNIKLMKTGGISVAEKINAACAAYGVPCMVGSMIEPAQSLAPAVAFAAAHDNVRFTDLDAVYMVADQQPALSIDGPKLTVNAHE